MKKQLLILTAAMALATSTFAMNGNAGNGNGGCGVGQQTNGCTPVQTKPLVTPTVVAPVANSASAANARANARSSSRANSSALNLTTNNTRNTATQTQGIDNSGNNAGVNTEVKVEAAEAARIPAPTAFAAPLTATNGTCLGSKSGGVQVPGLGLSGASTVLDTGCDNRYNSIRFQELGLKKAAALAMCDATNGRELLAAEGIVCPAPKIVPNSATTNQEAP